MVGFGNHLPHVAVSTDMLVGYGSMPNFGDHPDNPCNPNLPLLHTHHPTHRP
ncbi:hypothetical protein Hanom_Chr17g01535051 [Helianthus anomalus]